jgi:hypothetical protein
VLEVHVNNQHAWVTMAGEQQLGGDFKAKLAKLFRSRNVLIGIVLVIAMIVVLAFLPSITPSSMLYPWFIPLLELVLGCLLVIVIIMNHLDVEVQQIRDEAGLEHTGILLPRHKTEGWFFSLDNVYHGKSLAYAALRAYIVLLVKEGFQSFTLDEVAIELKVSDKQKKEGLTKLLAMACDDKLITASPGKNEYTIAPIKDGEINIKKTVKKRLPASPPAPPPRPPARPSRPPIRYRRRR